MQWPSPFSGKRIDKLPYVLGVAAVAVLVVLLAALAIRQEHDRRRHFAATVTRNLALLIEAQLAGVLAQADLRLQAAGADLPAAAESWSAALHTPAPGLQLDGPLKDTKGRWVLSLSRPARVAGAPPVRLDIPVDQFAGILQRVSLGPYGAATVRHASLALVYRQPMPANGLAAIGSTEVSRELRQMLAVQPEAGDYVAQTAVDGVARINAYQRVDGYPLYVIVGLPEDDFPRGWSPLDAALLTLAGCTLLVAAYAARQLYRSSRRQIDQVQRRHQAIVESSQDAIISKTLDGVITSWNRGAEQIFGYTAAEMIGQPARKLFPPERMVEEDDALSRLHQGQTVAHFATERLHRDGQRIVVSVTFSPVTDGDGRIVGASVIARDITRQQAMEAEVRELAFHDPLTHLANRRLLLDRMQHAQQTGRRTAQWSALLFLDLDGFKALNDSHGHDAGDAVLVEVARRLQAAVRESDTVARLGGDEFIVLCEHLGLDETLAREAVWAIEAKIDTALSRVIRLGDQVVVSRASIGHALFRGTERQVEQILRDADAAMYQQKQRRRGTG
jgi:diguanylate cyclase (GGDEF)-like protein/PAS domain S-box-containing protein